MKGDYAQETYSSSSRGVASKMLFQDQFEMLPNFEIRSRSTMTGIVNRSSWFVQQKCSLSERFGKHRHDIKSRHDNNEMISHFHKDRHNISTILRYQSYKQDYRNLSVSSMKINGFADSIYITDWSERENVSFWYTLHTYHLPIWHVSVEAFHLWSRWYGKKVNFLGIGVGSCLVVWLSRKMICSMVLNDPSARRFTTRDVFSFDEGQGLL